MSVPVQPARLRLPHAETLMFAFVRALVAFPLGWVWELLGPDDFEKAQAEIDEDLQRQADNYL